MRNAMLSFIGLFGVLALAACSGTDDGSPAADPGTESEQGPGGKADQWDSRNDPEQFQIDFEYAYQALEQYKTGRADQTPWPSDYWATYEDSINVRYAGGLSPAEKYDKAFNGWSADSSVSPMDVHADCRNGVIEDKHDEYYDQLGPAARWQHENRGNYPARNGVDDDGDGTVDECGGGDYDGVETWWGLCHAWVPAAILEPEPIEPVTINGVQFSTSDIKALLIASYDRSSALMLGGRCNEKEVERDEYGRLTQSECRDTNAGAFYVVITNMLGKMKRSFAEDRTAGYQVWNQPVLGYTIHEARELTEEQAVAKLGRPGVDYNSEFGSPDAASFRYVRMDVDYITESAASVDGPLTPNIDAYTRTDRYEMVIELDADGNVIGGEWLNYARETHPDFLWLPKQARGGNPFVKLEKVRELLTQSRSGGNGGGNGGGTPAASGSVILNEVLASPKNSSGDANGDGSADPVDDEFIEIVNTSAQAISLDGWTVADVAMKRFSFPSGTSLQPGKAILLFGGGYASDFASFSGTPALVSTQHTLGLSNKGDTVTLSAQGGEIMDQMSFGNEGGSGVALVRKVDGDPSAAWIQHPGKGFSPGTRVDGTSF